MMARRMAARKWSSRPFPKSFWCAIRLPLLYSKNNNLGMRMSRARYACLLNSDTKLLGNVFKVLVGFMDAHPEAAACGPRLLNPRWHNPVVRS